MRIRPLYEAPSRIKNKHLSSVIYKINKLILNLFYPVLVKSQYGIDANSDIVVSLTSFPGRINSVWITIETLLHQTVKPKAVILWLAKDQFPNEEDDLPDKLLKMKKYGLSIRFCDNLYPHKKYYYTMQEYPENPVITVDDDIFYPENLVEELSYLYDSYPNCICCTWAHEIVLKDGMIAPYSEWKLCINKPSRPSIRMMPVGCGGVLYPPHSLDNRVFDREMIEQLCLKTDDIWLKCMAVLKRKKAVRWQKQTPIFFSIINSQNVGLFHTNIGENRNDESVIAICSQFTEIPKLLE